MKTKEYSDSIRICDFRPINLLSIFAMLFMAALIAYQLFEHPWGWKVFIVLDIILLFFNLFALMYSLRIQRDTRVWMRREYDKVLAARKIDGEKV